jgi:hypothetical protein
MLVENFSLIVSVEVKMPEADATRHVALHITNPE